MPDFFIDEVVIVIETVCVVPHQLVDRSARSAARFFQPGTSSSRPRI